MYSKNTIPVMSVSAKNTTENNMFNFYDEYLNFSVIPENTHNYKYFFVDDSSFSWTRFISNISKKLDKDSKDYEAKRQTLLCWQKCQMCKKLFSRMSKLVNSKLKRVIFLLPIDSYPEEMRDAIRKLEQIGNLRRQVVYGLSVDTHSDIGPVYTGEEDMGHYDHITIKADMTQDTLKCSDMNEVLKKIHMQFVSNIGTWKYHIDALKIIDTEYREKGTTSAGYSQYAFVVKWMLKFLTDQILSEGNPKKIHIIATQEMIRLMGGRPSLACLNGMSRPENITGMIAMFSPKGNLYECLKVKTPEQFWGIMGARTDPTKYQVCTSAAKAGNIERCIATFGEEKLNEMFERESWDIHDPKIRKWMYYIRSNEPPTFGISQLRASAKPTKQRHTNCFSGSKTEQKTTYTLEEFLPYLTTIQAGSKVEWLTNNYYNVIYGFATCESGREITAREGSWIQTCNPRTIYTPKWVDVEGIGKHASTWKSSYPDKVIEGELGSGTHVAPLSGTQNGITIVVSKQHRYMVPYYTYNPECNALFAVLFNNNIHEFRKVRETYHNKTRIVNNVEEPYQGALISRDETATKKFFRNCHTTPQGNCLKFRIDGVVYEVY